MTEGHYERKHKANRLLAWSHRSRLRRAVQIILRTPGARLLDYGCGDGVLERLLSQEPKWKGSIIAVDVDGSEIRDCQNRLGNLPRTSFAEMDVLQDTGGFDIIVCLEVLEHVPPVEEVLQHLDELLKPGGLLVVSVPVETGVVLLAKQAIRLRLGGDYRFTERYSTSELIHALLPTAKTLHRPAYTGGDGKPYHGHKLFNWRWLRSRLQEVFSVEKAFGTPLPWPCSQKWFLCRKQLPDATRHE